MRGWVRVRIEWLGKVGVLAERLLDGWVPLWRRLFFLNCVHDSTSSEASESLCGFPLDSFVAKPALNNPCSLRSLDPSKQTVPRDLRATLLHSLRGHNEGRDS